MLMLMHWINVHRTKYFSSSVTFFPPFDKNVLRALNTEKFFHRSSKWIPTYVNKWIGSNQHIHIHIQSHQIGWF